MHEDDVFELLTGIDFSDSATKAEQLTAEAERLRPGEHGRATFLVAAGEHFQMRREYDAARRSYDSALADGGESRTSPLANLLSLAMETGDDTTASDLTAQLRQLAREGELAADQCHFIGEVFEENGDLREALRWYTLPLTHVEPDDEEGLDYLCLIARRRVRRELGTARDRYDAAAEVALAHQAEKHGDASDSSPT